MMKQRDLFTFLRSVDHVDQEEVSIRVRDYADEIAGALIRFNGSQIKVLETLVYDHLVAPALAFAIIEEALRAVTLPTIPHKFWVCDRHVEVARTALETCFSGNPEVHLNSLLRIDVQYALALITAAREGLF